MLYKSSLYSTHSSTHITLQKILFKKKFFCSGVIDSSGISFFYIDTPREHDAGILILGHSVSGIMMIPPGSTNYTTPGFCFSECTNQVGTMYIQFTVQFVCLFNVLKLSIFNVTLHLIYYSFYPEMELKYLLIYYTLIWQVIVQSNASVRVNN